MQAERTIRTTNERRTCPALDRAPVSRNGFRTGERAGFCRRFRLLACCPHKFKPTTATTKKFVPSKMAFVDARTSSEQTGVNMASAQIDPKSSTVT
eukprot:4372625-Prymnesium_polylepis.1